MLPTTGCAVSVVKNSAGPVHAVFTVTGISTNGLNSTVQVRVTADPIGRTGLEMLLDITRDGGGTACKHEIRHYALLLHPILNFYLGT